MGGIFGGAPTPPPPPDTTYLDQQRVQADAARAALDRKNKAKQANLRGRRAGRASLLFDGPLGVLDPNQPAGLGLKTTLGG